MDFTRVAAVSLRMGGFSAMQFLAGPKVRLHTTNGASLVLEDVSGTVLSNSSGVFQQFRYELAPRPRFDDRRKRSHKPQKSKVDKVAERRKDRRERRKGRHKLLDDSSLEEFAREYLDPTPAPTTTEPATVAPTPVPVPTDERPLELACVRRLDIIVEPEVRVFELGEHAVAVMCVRATERRLSFDARRIFLARF
jgi:hypothetical protein